MTCTNCWIVELHAGSRTTVFVEQDPERARSQFHMLVDTALNQGPVGAYIHLLWVDASANLQGIAMVTVSCTL